MNDEIEQLRRQRLAELQANAEQSIKEQVQLQQQVEQLESMAKQFMTKEAISRYGNLKAAHPEKALQISLLIAQAVQTGQLKEKIDDTQLKQILLQLNQRKDFKITKK